MVWSVKYSGIYQAYHTQNQKVLSSKERYSVRAKFRTNTTYSIQAEENYQNHFPFFLPFFFFFFHFRKFDISRRIKIY